MTYATLQDLLTYAGEAELIQLTDRSDPPAYAIDQAVVDQALADADDLVNGYLAAKYQLPLSVTPSLIATAARDIARYKLFRSSPTAEVTERYKEAIASLEKVNRGQIQLNLPATGEEPGSREGVIVTAGPERLFSRDSLGGL